MLESWLSYLLKSDEVFICVKRICPLRRKNNPIYLEMTIDLKDIVQNNKNDDKIIAEMGNNLENNIDFDRNWRYEFLHSRTCC